MLRITVSHSGEAASAYFTKALSKEGEYYLEKEIISYFEGKTARYLGIEGRKVTKEDFDALARGIHPVNGKNLKVRKVSNARAGQDYTINIPKSVTLTYFFTKDEQILDAVKEANNAMMHAIENHAQTQANTQDERIYLDTKNLIYSSFLHHTSRPVPIKQDGKTIYIPDPNIHIHNFIFNLTSHPFKNRIQALEMGNVHRQAELFQEVFHSHLSHRLNALGYHIERTPDRFEIIGLSKFNERFSNRTLHINKVAKEKGITDPKALSELGAKTRHSKGKSSVGEKELYTHWRARLTDTEFKAIQSIKGKYKDKVEPVSVATAINRSLEHHLERNSTAREASVLAYALKIGYGALLPEDVKKELNSRENILRSDTATVPVITTREMVRFEDKMIDLATKGKGRFSALHLDYTPKEHFLNEQQKAAIDIILRANDQVMILNGAAGSGKTTLLLNIAEAARVNGRSVLAVAPSTQAAQVLKKQGFEANTVAALLHNPALQEKLKHSLLIVDEAGLMGVKSTLEILSLANKYQSRVLLSGDVFQHGSPGEYGDALKILQDKARLTMASVQKVVRQKPDDFRAVVEKLAEGKTLQGYKALDTMGRVKEIPDYEQRMETVVNDYVSAVKSKKDVLAISPTNYEGELLTQTIRERLKKEKIIKGKERPFETLRNLSLTVAERKDMSNYQENQVIRFIKNQKGGFKAGQHYQVIKKDKKTVSVKNLETGVIAKLPYQAPKHFQVYEKKQRSFAINDRIRMTNNLKTQQNTKVNNGNTYRITGFTKSGDIKLDNKKTLSKNAWHIKHALVDTSYASQGKTCDEVFILQSDLSFGPASDAKQLYVSVSRARNKATIYTSSKDELKKNIAKSGDRQTAKEVAEDHQRHLRRQKQYAHYQTLNEKSKHHGRVRTKQKSASRDVSRSKEPKR